LRKGELKTGKRLWIISTICIFVVIISYKLPLKPKIITNVTTLDHVYLTILVNRSETKNIEKLEEKILKMCREDAFGHKMCQNEETFEKTIYRIQIYHSRKDLKRGNPILEIRKDAGK
jgi:hypothetical protein